MCVLQMRPRGDLDLFLAWPQIVVATMMVACLTGSRGWCEEVVLQAADLSNRSANVAPTYPQFGNLTLCVGKQGLMAWSPQVAGGSYHIHFLYCSGEQRPCALSVNGRSQPTPILGNPTGGFMPTHLTWETCGPFRLEPGRNEISLTTPGFMPHLKALVISTDKQPPSKDEMARPKESFSVEQLQSQLHSLIAAITDLRARYAVDYPRADLYLTHSRALGQELQHGQDNDEFLRGVSTKITRLRYRALVLDNPLFACGKLLFIRRYTYQSSHYYTDYIDGCRNFGGNLCELSLSDGSITELVPQFEAGIFGRYDLSFDGRRVLFDYKAKAGEGFRLWEVNVDGTGLRQVTAPPADEAERVARYWQRNSEFLQQRNADYRHHTDDMHPCYLPDGGICFVSTRCERGILCDGPDVLTTTSLYRVDSDGGNMRVLSQSPVSEASPSVMNDGRILYTRWEYVDKADVVIKCLWAMWPDGSRSAEVFGNDITFPDTLLHGRAVPGHNNLFVVIGAPHMPLGAGTVIRLDINHPIRTRLPMTYITPDVDVRSEFGWVHLRGGAWISDQEGPLYTDAQPLDDKFFLVSCNPDQDCHDLSAYGLYLLDEFGNRVLIHRDQEFSCWQPMLLRPRLQPPVLWDSNTAEHAAHQATLIMNDVYAGLTGVPRGTVKYLRVMETVARPWAARRFWEGDSHYQQHAVVSMNTHLHVKNLIGIVPVEEDGSASFRVPADKNLFFQALDKDYMEVQRMRTFVNLRPGETRACIGCHQDRNQAPSSGFLAALRRTPCDLAPQPGEAAPRPIHYPSDVQPLLDKHCVRCHNAETTEGDVDLSGEMTELFCRSYETLVGRDWVKVWRENEPKTGDASPLPAYTLGSHASRLIQLLRNGHEDTHLSPEEMITLVTWIDANAPYYGSYFGRRNLKYQNHPDFRPVPTLPLTDYSLR